MHEYKMAGAERLGYMTEGVKDSVRSICWECKRPVGECSWAMRFIPYKGTQYWERECFYENHTTYSVYSIVSCPMEVK